MRYFQPTSLTWWAGLLAVLTGSGALFLPDQGQLAPVQMAGQRCRDDATGIVVETD